MNTININIFKPADIVKRQQEYKFIRLNKILKEKGYQNPDGSWDVKGDVNISDMGLTEIPVKFNNVDGFFDCSGNKLTSLEGCPKVVEGSFYCSFNNLTSLKGCPKLIEGYFDCSLNNLKSLKDGPEIVNGSFYCGNNNVQFTGKDVRKYCNVRGNIYV